MFQILLVFETGAQGKIAIDNIGKSLCIKRDIHNLTQKLPIIENGAKFMAIKPFHLFKGPCSFDELFFPYSSNSPTVFGSCHLIKFNGKSRYLETDTVCLNNYGSGSKRSTSSQRGADFGLFMGVLDFYNDRSIPSRYD